MNITLIITNLDAGGAEAMLLKLLQHIDRKNFTPTVVSLVGLGVIGPKIVNLGIPVYALGMKPGGIPNPFVILRLTALLHKLKPDIVHTWMYHADLIGGISARLAGCQQVVWGIRHCNLSKSENKLSTLLVVKVCSVLSSWLPKYILSCSYRAKDVHASVGYSSEKMHVIPNGFDLSRFIPDLTARSSVREELGLPVEAQLVGLIARFDSQKNHMGFIEAAAVLQSQLPKTHFLLVGTDINQENTELTAAINEKGLQKCMHLLGRRDDIPRLMASLDVLASSSHGEAFPNVLGEALSCGVPCVVTDVGDSLEIVGGAGRVVSAGDMKGLASGLLEILSLDTITKAELSKMARGRVLQNYEIKHITNLYEEFYLMVCN